MDVFSLRFWVHYYIRLLKKLGPVKFSLILALAIIFFDSLLQILLLYYFEHELSITDIARSLILGIIITPWSVYFLSVIAEELKGTKENLKTTVSELENAVKINSEKNIALEFEVKERNIGHQKLEEHTILLRSFIDETPDIIFYRNLNGEFVACNIAMTQLVGKSEAELIGLTPFDVFELQYAQQVALRDKTIIEEKQLQINQDWLTYPNGKKVFFELRVQPLLNSKKQCIGIIGFGTDITQRKEENELLEQINRDKTAFISTISHELRTPLNGIVGLTRMLLDDSLTTVQEKHLKTIHISAIMLGNIFSDIVDLDKIDRNCLKLVVDVFNLDEFLEDLERLSYIQSHQKGLSLTFEKNTCLPIFINSDATRIRQVLWNLISNAVKFTAVGEIKINVSFSIVDDQHATLSFEITDCGIGIAEDQLDKIFSMYYQVPGEHNGRGSGIGLAVSAEIVKTMSGTLSVISEEEGGSTFKLCLPVDYSYTAPKSLTPLVVPLISILLVEDIELNILVTKSLLEKQGHSVDCARTGKEAIESVSNNTYDLILMDIQLPDMDGFQVTQCLRENNSNLPPIVALTANVFKNKNQFKESGMLEVLEKPLSLDALNAMFNKVFGNGQLKPGIKALNYKNEQTSDESEHPLNIAMLSELLEFIPVSGMLKNVTLFETLFPNYFQLLESEFSLKNHDKLVEHAHKIKSAAASIGLKRIQNIASEIESSDLGTWTKLKRSVLLLDLKFKSDVEILKKWLTDQK